MWIADFQSLVFNSGPDWPSTSVMEMNTYAGIPLDKIVIGKPINAGAANNGCDYSVNSRSSGG